MLHSKRPYVRDDKGIQNLPSRSGQRKTCYCNEDWRLMKLSRNFSKHVEQSGYVITRDLETLGLQNVQMLKKLKLRWFLKLKT